jgi:putrescine transport system permease protein
MIRSLSPFTITCLGLGLVFLYVPIGVLILYSFSASSLTGIWGGFSLHWYALLFQDAAVMRALRLSLEVGVLAATLGTALGIAAAFALVRYPGFRGINLFVGLVTAPLIMPEVVTGLALLLVFVALQESTGWPTQRGLLTITLAHSTFTMAYVTVVMQARLMSFDRAPEEAALNLGARPFVVFWLITLPIVFPAVVTSWLLALTLSLDSLVISSFVAGPGASTLPMIIFSKLRFGISPEINAIAALVVTITGSFLILASLIGARRSARVRDSQSA